MTPLDEPIVAQDLVVFPGFPSFSLLVCRSPCISKPSHNDEWAENNAVDININLNRES
jgi:hypothetical protein